MSAPTAAPPTTPLPLKLAAAVAVVVVLAVGGFVVSGLIAPGYYSSIALGIGWFVLVSVVLGRLTKGRRDLRRWTRAAFLLTAAASVFAFWWTSVRETEVNEDVATGMRASDLRRGERSEARRPVNVELAAGSVESLAHGAEGRAAVVRLARGGRKLTLTDFDIDPGPEVEVRLIPRGADEGTDDHEDLGDLKGSKGNQQYTIPAGVDVDRYATVVFWCVPFSQALAKADLTPS